MTLLSALIDAVRLFATTEFIPIPSLFLSLQLGAQLSAQSAKKFPKCPHCRRSAVSPLSNCAKVFLTALQAKSPSPETVTGCTSLLSATRHFNDTFLTYRGVLWLCVALVIRQLARS
jgi:hypothetical protein